MYIKDTKLVTWLHSLASEEVRRYDDEFCGDTFSGGNYDDAWDNGIEDGMRILARSIVLHLTEQP